MWELNIKTCMLRRIWNSLKKYQNVMNENNKPSAILKIHKTQYKIKAEQTRTSKRIKAGSGAYEE